MEIFIERCVTADEYSSDYICMVYPRNEAYTTAAIVSTFSNARLVCRTQRSFGCLTQVTIFMADELSSRFVSSTSKTCILSRVRAIQFVFQPLDSLSCVTIFSSMHCVTNFSPIHTFCQIIHLQHYTKVIFSTMKLI